MLTRRTLLTLSPLIAASCAKERGSGFEGHAFVANEEGQAIAAVNLTAFAVTRHIRLPGRPTQVLSHPARKAVFALTPSTGSIHEIDPASLSLRRSKTFCSRAAAMALSSDGESLWLAAADPKRLLKISPDTLEITARLDLPAEPSALHLAPREPWAALTFLTLPPAFISTTSPKNLIPSNLPYIPQLALFRSDGRQFLTTDGPGKRLTLITVPDAKIIAHLPVSIEPQHIAAKPDGGQIFLTGPGQDAVVILYPYRAEIAETVLAGRRPGAMAAASTEDVDLLFVANPAAGSVTILDILTHRMVGAVTVGKLPAYLTVTPDNQYALVLNQESGDMAVIRVKSVTRNRGKQAPLFTMIPVGSKPLSATIQQNW